MKKQKVTVVGLGYVGLPLALLAREKGWQVEGYEAVSEKVKKINAGISPIQDEALSRQLKRFPIHASTDPACVADSSVIVIAVPTPVTGMKLPDLKPLKSALLAIQPFLSPGQVLIIESTVNPGVMDEVVIPLLKQRRDLPLEADSSSTEALYLAHCPERINPGDKKWTLRNIPRVIGGYSERGVALAKRFYESILEAPVMVMGSVAEAEAVKILENSFRDINIAFVNEMAKSFDRLGIDVLSVIQGAATKPFGFLPHYPGNGVGGHCISVDPYYMIERARQVGFNHQFLKLARKINDGMPTYVVSRLLFGMRQLKLSSRKTKVALLGLSYKKDVDDLRNSPVLTIKKLLLEKGFTLAIFDPYLPQQSTVKSVSEALQGAGAVMLGTDHTSIVQHLTPRTLKEAGVRIVVDGKNALPPHPFASAGVLYLGIGRSSLSSS